MLALKAKIEHVAQSVPNSVLNTKNIFNNATSNLKIDVSVMSRSSGGFSSSIVFMSNNDSLGSTVEVELREAFRDKFREDHLEMLGKGKLELYSVVHRTFEKVAKEKDFLARVVKNREDEIAKVAYRNDPSLRPLFERREVKSEEIEFDAKENILMEKEEVVLPTVEDMNVTPEALAVCNVVVTGFVPDEKKQLEDMVTGFNGTVSETVTQTTSFVLTGPEPSRTKIAAAKTSNVLLVSLPTLIKVLTGEIKLDEMKHQLPPNIIRYGLSKSNFSKPSTNANASSDAEKENNTPNQVDRQSNLVTDAKSVGRASFGMEDLSDMELDEESSNPADRKRKSDVLDKQAASLDEQRGSPTVHKQQVRQSPVMQQQPEAPAEPIVLAPPVPEAQLFVAPPAGQGPQLLVEPLVGQQQPQPNEPQPNEPPQQPIEPQPIMQEQEPPVPNEPQPIQQQPPQLVAQPVIQQQPQPEPQPHVVQPQPPAAQEPQPPVVQPQPTVIDGHIIPAIETLRPVSIGQFTQVNHYYKFQTGRTLKEYKALPQLVQREWGRRMRAQFSVLNGGLFG